MRESLIQQLYNDSTSFNVMIRKIKVFCLIQKEYNTNITLENIFNSFESIRNNSKNKIYLNFKNYLLRTWLNENSIYKVDSLNVSDKEIRRNNYNETVHKGINEKIHKRVDIVSMIQIIRDINEENELKFQGIKKIWRKENYTLY